MVDVRVNKATPARLSAFSDGVFAVLITVLVLDLRPPYDIGHMPVSTWHGTILRIFSPHR